MNKKQLAQLVDLAQTRNDAATRNLGHSNARKKHEQDKLDMLERYWREYQAQLEEVARSAALAPDTLRNYHEFLNKLESAIDQQRRLLVTCEQQVEQTRSEWQAAHRKLKSFDTLKERADQGERLKELRREQREQDELISRSRGNP